MSGHPNCNHQDSSVITLRASAKATQLAQWETVNEDLGHSRPARDATAYEDVQTTRKVLWLRSWAMSLETPRLSRQAARGPLEPKWKWTLVFTCFTFVRFLVRVTLVLIWNCSISMIKLD